MLDLSRLRTRKEVKASWRAALAPVLACVTSCECVQGCMELNDKLQLLRWVLREQHSTTDAARRCLLAAVSFAVACGLSGDGQNMLRSSASQSLLVGLQNSLMAVLDVPEAGPGLWELAHFTVHVLAKWMEHEKRQCRIMLSPSYFFSSGAPARKKARSETSTRPPLAFVMMQVSLGGILHSGVLGKQLGNIGKRSEKWVTFQTCVKSVVRIATSATYQDMTITTSEGVLCNIVCWCSNTVSALFATASYHNSRFLTAATFASDTLFELSLAASRLLTPERIRQLWDTCMEMFRAFAVPQDCPPFDVVRISKRLILAVQNLATIALLSSTVTSTMVMGMMTLLHWSCYEERLEHLRTDETNDVATYLYDVVRSSGVRKAWTPAFFSKFRYEHLSRRWLQTMQAVLHGMIGRWGCSPPFHINWSRRRSTAFLARAIDPLFPPGTSLQTATAMVQCMASVAREPWLCLCVVFACVL